MSSRVVDGLVLPQFVAGVPALEFCNTRAGWGSAAPKEYLLSYEHLALWAREAALVPDDDAAALVRLAARNRRDAVAEVAAALRLRGALRAVLLGSLDGPGWRLLAATAAEAARAARLVHRDGLVRWDLSGSGLARPRLAVAAAAVDFLLAGGPPAVAECPGEGCGWIFHDPRRRRRWCDMAVCGNRAKARRHAERLRGAAVT